MTALLTTAGSVAPNSAFCGKRRHKMPLAVNAPAHWLKTYRINLGSGKRRAAKNPRLTAGFKCAPEMSPTV